MQVVYNNLDENGKYIGPITVFGSLDLSYSPLVKLPDNLTVFGMCDLMHTDLKRLPENLTVFGDLDIEGTGITRVPGTLFVSGDLDIHTLENIAIDNICSVRGEIYGP